MCAICLCEHQNQQHGRKVTHITNVIQEVLERVSSLMLNGEDQQQLIAGYNKKAEELMDEKEKTRVQVDDKLASLRAFYKKQKALVGANNAAILHCHELILKATQKSEYKIQENMKDPKKIERRVADMIQKEDYWTAFEEANRALTEDACFDDAQIKEEFVKAQTLLKAYHEQLEALDITPLRITKYNQLVEHNTGLVRECEMVKSNSLYIIIYAIRASARWTTELNYRSCRTQTHSRRTSRTHQYCLLILCRSDSGGGEEAERRSGRYCDATTKIITRK
jgi:hypothetical protein